ncbi:unnamed protein product [Adineta steineri]|uniref:Uncharacterized protein n=1 Tax=Adineta steineri TaxID=433720 RepID=A0A813V6Y0_9BILA|nr:unnamed protein product [Adineta steineri]CAF3815369.1 unnamed protein product [Adineta steineri]
MSPSVGICALAVLRCTDVVRCNTDNRTCPIENTVCINSTRCGQPVCYPLALANKLVCPKNTTATTAPTTTARTATTTRAGGLTNTILSTTRGLPLCTTVCCNGGNVNGTLCLHNNETLSCATDNNIPGYCTYNTPNQFVTYCAFIACP